MDKKKVEEQLQFLGSSHILPLLRHGGSMPKSVKRAMESVFPFDMLCAVSYGMLGDFSVDRVEGWKTSPLWLRILRRLQEALRVCFYLRKGDRPRSYDWIFGMGRETNALFLEDMMKVLSEFGITGEMSFLICNELEKMTLPLDVKHQSRVFKFPQPGWVKISYTCQFKEPYLDLESERYEEQE